MKILLLTRAFKNFGDFLIARRGLAFLKRKLPPGVEIMERPGDRPVTDASDCILIPGGPSARNGVFPGLYPLSEQVLGNHIPIYFLGIGSKLVMDGLDSLGGRLDEATQKFFRHCNEFAPIGVRDELTAKMFEAHGIKASFNGCPGWYSERYPNGDFPDRKQVTRVVLTTPASFAFVPEFKKTLNHCVDRFGAGNLAVSFNHGTTSADPVAENCVEYVRARGIAVIDASGGLHACDEYDKFDFHIGYRVHTHIYFCSEGRPSVLIPEDSRGVGASQSLQTPVSTGYEISPHRLRLVHRLKSFPIAWPLASRRAVIDAVQGLLTADADILSLVKQSNAVIDGRRRHMDAFIDKYVLKNTHQ